MRTAVCVTPPGRSAIASIEVTGFESPDEFKPFFRPAGPKEIGEHADGRVIFGHWHNLSGTFEELVVTRVSQREIHIHCHGGISAVSAVLDSLASIGFETRRIAQASWDSCGSRYVDEIECALVHAPTRKIAFLLLGLSRLAKTAFRDLKCQIEESPEIGLDQLRSLHKSYETGKFLARPASVVLAGRPNVGKSSINNRVLGYERSITFDQPGTTRDIVSEATTIDGWSFEFSDTAGIRTAEDSIEVTGVEMAQRLLENADQVVWIESAESDFETLLAGTNANADVCSTSLPDNLIRVINKVDLLGPEPSRILSQRCPDLLLTNANSGQGIEELMARIKASVIGVEPDGRKLVLFNLRQRRLVEQSLCALESGEIEAAKKFLESVESGQ